MLEKFSPKRLLEKLKTGLSKTRENFVGRMTKLFSFWGKIDEAFWEELEEILISADVGVATTGKIIKDLRGVVEVQKIKDPKDLMEVLKANLAQLMRMGGAILAEAPEPPTVILMVGVNGTGKTTSIAKLAWRLKSEGKKVLLAAADTFRAAAIDQLEVWAKRLGLELIRHREGADPAAVAFDAVSAARARKYDYVIVDTAGRLHSKVNLMEELGKVRRVIAREIPGAPHETLLVLDATTGQNAYLQAKTFKSSVDVTGIILAKLDGTAKGGIVIGIADEMGIPVKFVGIGETLEDLKEFDSETFLEALFEQGDGKTDVAS